MTTTTLWVIRTALAVQFLGVLAVAALVPATDAQPNTQTIGVLGSAAASCGLLSRSVRLTGGWTSQP